MVCYDELMKSLGTILLIFFLVFYGFSSTVAMIILLVLNSSKTRKLRQSQNTIDALRRQIAEMNRASQAGRSAPAAAPAPKPVQQQPVQRPAVQPQAAAPRPAPSASQPVAAVTSTPAPAPAPKPAPKPREKVKFSSINISFAVGVLLITIVGAVFISSSWGFMNDAVRAGVLIGVVALVFFLSYLSGKVLKLRQTGFAFYTLGSLLLPVVTCGIGAMELFGEWFSFAGDGAAIVAACAALLFGAAGYAGVRIYKSGAYYGIMYLGFTWTLLFVAAQFAYKFYDRVGCCFLALSAASLAATLFSRDKRSEEIKFFKLYSRVITYVSLGAILLVVWNFEYIPVSIGLGLIIATLLTGTKKWMGYAASAVMLIFSLYATSFTEFEYNDRTYPLMVYAAFITAFFVLLKVIKRSSVVSDLILTASLVGGIFAGWIEYRAEFVSFYFVTMGVILVTTLVAGYLAFAKGQRQIISYIFAAVASLTGMALVYCVGTGIFYDNSLGRALEEFSYMVGGKVPSHLNTNVLYAASAMAYIVELILYILCNYMRRKHPSLRICSYAFMFATFVSAFPTLGVHMMFLAICTSAIVRSVRMSITEKETATKVSRVLSAISHYTAMAFAAFVFGKQGSVIYMLCLLMVFASLYIRVAFGGSKWQRFISPALATLISVYATTFIHIPESYGDDVEIAVFGICLLVFYIFSDLSKLRNAVTDLSYPVVFLFASLIGTIDYDADRVSLLTIAFMAVSVLLMAVCAFRKENDLTLRVTALIAGGVISSELYYCVGTLFFDKTGDIPRIFAGILSLISYIVCAIVIPKIKGKTMAAWASYAFYTCSIMALTASLNTTILSIRATASALLIVAAFAAIFSRYLAKPAKHPDIRACAALVLGLGAVLPLICSVFKGDTMYIAGIVFYLVVLVVCLIPHIKDHEVTGRYIAAADITSAVLGSSFILGLNAVIDYPWIGVLIVILIVALLYIKKNTVVAIIPIVIGIYLTAETVSSFDGYYVILCAIGILLIGLGLLLHKKAFKAPLYLDYLTYVSVVFPLLGNYDDIRTFAILLTIALVLVSHAIRYPKAKAILLSISSSFMCLGILSLQFIEDLPEIIKGEVIMILILLDVFLIRNVIKPGKDSTMRVIWIVTVSICLAIEGLSAAATGEILDLLITGIVSVAIFIYAFIAKDKSWFLLSVIAIIAIAVYLSATFWASKAWLVYLLVVGVILISMAAINEYGKRKAELSGEQTEGGGAGVKRFFEEWKW
ncbi:hypothetical protein SAMN06296952_0840 [Oscillospiraceae bacterium]|nr:hypothetical protein SAMN06296952_0840 [Oscillospiraceae bacterium]